MYIFIGVVVCMKMILDQLAASGLYHSFIIVEETRLH